MVLVLAVGVTGALTYRWWVNWQAHIEINGWGVQYRDGHPRDGITSAQTFSSSQDTVRYDAHRQLQLTLLFSSDRHVRITRVTWNTTPVQLVKPVSEQIEPTASGQQPWRPFKAFDPRDGAGTWMRITLRFQDCEYFSTGTGVGYDNIDVTYEALGRTRHQTVQFPTWLAVTAPGDKACPGRGLPGRTNLTPGT